MGGGGAGGGKPAPLLAPQKFSGPPTSSTGHLTVDQQNRIQEDLADRERQAAELASAVMLTDHNGGQGQHQHQHQHQLPGTMSPVGLGQVLQAPPPLVSMVPPVGAPGTTGKATTISNGANGDMAMEAINWNAIPELGNPDDMDMDFAAMFDAEQEQSFLAHPGHPGHPAPQGNGSANATTKGGIPNPLNSTG